MSYPLINPLISVFQCQVPGCIWVQFIQVTGTPVEISNAATVLAHNYSTHLILMHIETLRAANLRRSLIDGAADTVACHN